MSKSIPLGAFCWRDILTTNLQAAESFYNAMFGWEFRAEKPAGPGNCMPYTMIRMGGVGIGGAIQMPPEWQVPSHWCPYIHVADCPEATGRARDAGAEVIMENVDVGVGMFSLIAPAHLAPLHLYQSKSPSDNFAPKGPGTFTWDECLCHDATLAEEELTRMLGYGFGDFQSPGYRLIMVDDAPVGGLLALSPDRLPRPAWLSYVVVPDCVKALQHAATLGASIAEPAMQVPMVGTVAVILDPTGASLGLIQPLA